MNNMGLRGPLEVAIEWRYLFARIGWMLVVFGVMIGCGFENGTRTKSKGGGGGGEVCEGEGCESNQLRGFTAFSEGLVDGEDSVYDVLTTNCKTCHGGSQSPLFAVSDARTAYETIWESNLVSMDSPALSRLIVKGGTSHGGCQTCGPDLRDELEPKIIEWMKVEKEDLGETVSKNITSSVTIDAAELSDEIPRKFEFELSGLGFSGAKLEVYVKRQGEEDYSILRPRLITGEDIVQIKEIKPLLNGAWSPTDSNFVQGVNHVIEPNSNVTLHPTPEIVLDNKEDEADTLSFEIVTLLKKNEVWQVNDLTKFIEDVRPILAGNCFACHQGGGVAQEKFNMNTQNNVVLASRVLQRHNVVTAFAHDQKFGHSRQMTAPEANTVKAWIEAELVNL